MTVAYTLLTDISSFIIVTSKIAQCLLNRWIIANALKK